FEERFIATGLPYRVIGGPRFYERAEIRDAVAYLRVRVQPEDDLAFERIVNRPKRGLGEATLQLLSQTARAAGTPLVEAAHSLRATDELRPQVRTQLGRLLDAFDRWRRAVPTTPPGELAGIVLEESGYVAMWQNDRSPDAAGRLENLKEFVRAVAEFDTLAGFLEHIGLVMDNASDPAGDMASVMTLHGAKGLEFDHVFLPGWEEGLFPTQRALDEGGLKALEEERRLAYVGLTRARRSALVTFAANRRIYNQWASSVPSRFVEELPPGHIEFLHRQVWPEHEPSGLFDDLALQAPRGNRFRTLRAKEGPVIDGRAERVAAPPPMAGGRAIQVGNRVFHQKFGYGQVATVEGNKLEIRFDKAGTKKVIDSFVELV
ncbi:MAG TPA: 3'-5' exonuclease, partial [Geminicoccaceae bacterium]|nr:3'-5' exonuclease [Geminicoccaceae bacterium]